MIKVAPFVALLAAAVLLSPVNAAWAISTESTDESTGGAAVTDPDDQIDEIANPNSSADGSDDTDGSATINLPPIDMPGDSEDYTSPDSDDEPADDSASPPSN
jgi:hypothetical protein